jgi:hypothetical protein
MIVGIGPIRCNISDAGFIGSAFPDRARTLLSRIPEMNQECPRYVKIRKENFPWQIAP